MLPLASGGGGSGPAFANGRLLEVFPDWQEQVLWVNTGSDGWAAANDGATTFGATEEPVGSGMPGFGPLGSQNNLSCEDILMVVRYEREFFAGAEPDAELNELTDKIAAGETVEVPNCTS